MKTLRLLAVLGLLFLGSCTFDLDPQKEVKPKIFKDIQVSINVADNAKNVSRAKKILIEFSGKVFTSGGAEVNATNIKNALSFRENSDKGNAVPFDVDMSSKGDVTIKSNALLLKESTKYYFGVDGKKLKGANGEKVLSKALFFTTAAGIIYPLNIKDPLYKDQWYLENTGQFGGKAGVDLNVKPVWQKGFQGQGMFVGVLDDFVQRTHPDLQANLPAENVVDYYPEVPVKDRGHGTGVAGIIAAKGNTIGIRGIAPEATLYGYGVSDEKSKKKDKKPMETSMALALRRAEHRKIAVYNASLGPHEGKYQDMPADFKSALENVLKNGFGGKGAALVFAAGNSFLNMGNPSNNLFLNHRGIIGVNTVERDGTAVWSTGGIFGVNLWIGGPSSIMGRKIGNHMITTDLVGADGKPGDYSNFNSTSGASPTVAGVIALLRQAHPTLTWRDVKLILAESARKITMGGQVYQTTGKMYGNKGTQQKYSLKTGFGLIDAAAALELANRWQLLPPEKTESYAQSTALNTPKTHTFAVSELIIPNSSRLNFIESVTLEMEVATRPAGNTVHFFERDLILVAPDGTESPFFKKGGNFIVRQSFFDKSITKLHFLSNMFLGRDKIAGKWQLKIRQTSRYRAISQIKNWKLIFHGH